MEISRSLLTFLFNSLWQIPFAAAVAALACRLLRRSPASHRHAVWVAAMIAAILLPAASIRNSTAADVVEYSPSLAMTAPAGPSSAHANIPPAPFAPAAPSRTISFGASAAALLLGGYLLFVAFRLARLAWAAAHTVRVRRQAQPAEIPTRLERVRARCEEAFGLIGVELLFSRRLSGPVTAGSAIVLPESLLAESSEDVLTTAIGHEMAHIARRDFACNLFYELLHLPVAFHPAAWFIRRGIERTREMACDDLVTERLMDRGAYARSIVSIAAAMTALPRPGYTLGVFDGDILEERIRRLMERPAANLQRARLLLAGGLSALALCAVLASGLAFNARAQGAAGDMLKAGDAAYQRGDLKQAAALYESAVRLDSSNLQAKLLLGKALLDQYIPGTDPSSPYVSGATAQFQAVLDRDPSNKQAIHGMMMLTVNTKQFVQAHEWAQKAIAADATDVAGYYTSGFVDWSLSYPDYAAARRAAGMGQGDPGIIPDPGLRQNVRTQHEAQLDDGVRMLQTALQINPDYSDAMAYMNLLLRIKAGIANTQAEYNDLTAKADDWVSQALDAKRRQAQAARENRRTAAPGAATRDAFVAPPPPPPPPPPPGEVGVVGGVPGGIGGGIRSGVGDGVHQGVGMGVGVGVVHVDGATQQARIVKQTPPVYPDLARDAGVTGTVSLNVIIGKDGTMQQITVVSGHPLLVGAAINAVKTWVYQPTLLNGQPVEVASTVNVTFNGQ